MKFQFAWLMTFFALLGAVCIALAIASEPTRTFMNLPIAWISIASVFVVQLVGFFVAWAKHSERFFDALGSASFLLATWLAVVLSQSFSVYSLLLAAMVSIWAIRLGTFLSVRIRKAGEDRRFNRIRGDFAVFFMTWTLQGLWVTLTLAPALAVFTARAFPAIDVFFIVGALVWCIGFAIECIADAQKAVFTSNPDNAGKFIATGLWASSQHPNYFGEITLWLGIAVIAFPNLTGWQNICLISPIFVYLLLVHISGIRMLDASARRRWGKDEAYQRYTAITPKLIPRIWTRQ